MAAVRTYEGVIDNGLIRLAPEIRLPEKNQLLDFAKEVWEADGDAQIGRGTF
jgi:hypothetical protein